MSEFDFDAFWREDALAHRDNCFYKAKQVALGIRMSDECVFAELQEEGTPWKPIPRARRLELNKRYNDKSERIVGLRLLSETLPPPDAAFPPVRRIGEVFGGQYIYQHDTEWLTQSADTPEELETLLDAIDRMDLRAFMLPPEWEAEKKRLYETYGLKPQPLRHIRGPVTLACSIYGSENLIYLGLDEPDLFRRFSQTILRVQAEMSRIMDEEAGVTAQTHRGFSFADDNCCLLTPELYKEFGYPVLEGLWKIYSPDPQDMRYQHSDSAMAHIIPVLAPLDLTGVNFGPTVTAEQIRPYLPHARIDGCIAPFTFMRNDREQITREVLRDIQDGFTYGGMNISTAGSINDGSSLESMRLIMELIAEHTR